MRWVGFRHAERDGRDNGGIDYRRHWCESNEQRRRYIAPEPMVVLERRVQRSKSLRSAPNKNFQTGSVPWLLHARDTACTFVLETKRTSVTHIFLSTALHMS